NSLPGGIQQQNPSLATFAFGGPSAFQAPGVPASVDRYTFGSDLKIDTLDLVATAGWSADDWTILGGMGARYHYLSQSYSGVLSNLNPGATLVETLRYRHNFQGGGPTVLAEIRWRPRSGALALFANARGSLLIGVTRQVTEGSIDINDPAGTFT